jgi:hypothetical protein
MELAVTWDYRCPFARNFSEHVLVGLAAGADWSVSFWPFSLEQAHVEEGGPDVWDDPAKAGALLAMQVGVAVRDLLPAEFPSVHAALFAARHDEGRDLRDEAVLRDVLQAHHVDVDGVFEAVSSGTALETFRKEHERAVADHAVFGVPTVVSHGQAVFVRVMHRPHGDAELARRTVERVVDLAVGWVDLNELKHTTIPR